MEPKQIFVAKLDDFKRAVSGFSDSLNIDIDGFDEIVADSIQNGQIQKFEYCSELTWKLIKRFLFLFDGIETNSPKGTIKGFYLTKHIDEEGYEALLSMLDDRNRLSHIYRHDFFKEIHGKLNCYLSLMDKILKILDKRELYKA